jgi:hypothetical protein
VSVLGWIMTLQAPIILLTLVVGLIVFEWRSVPRAPRVVLWGGRKSDVQFGGWGDRGERAKETLRRAFGPDDGERPA